MAMHKPTDYTCLEMQPLVARVKNGRLVLDEPTDLPEGEEVRLMPIDDGLDDEEREALHREIEASIDDHEAGRVFTHEEVMAELLAKRS